MSDTAEITSRQVNPAIKPFEGGDRNSPDRPLDASCVAGHQPRRDAANETDIDPTRVDPTRDPPKPIQGDQPGTHIPGNPPIDPSMEVPGLR